jgi:predicted ABC-class ATPase
MIIPAGITTIVGGGFHGKSTLLQAISLGVWNHIPGDGREFVVTNPTAIPVRSEDGRSVTGVDISPFISNLPGGVTTSKWSSDDASGSTSMAAGVIEVVSCVSEFM